MKVVVSVARKLGIIAVVLILLMAFFVSITWVVSPILHKHRTDIETWVSQLLGLPVAIQRVDLSWYHYQPVISLNSVTLQNKETHQPVLQIKKVLVFFSIPKTIWHWQFMPSTILVSGAEVNINQSAKGEITLQGFPSLGGYNAAPFKQESNFKEMLGWLALQPRIILENIDIRYKGPKDQKRYVTLYQLSLRNQNADHVILGKAILHQPIATEVTVALRWLGTDLDLSKIKAKGYLYVSGLSLGQWFSDSKWHDWQLKHGIASAKIWANWHLGKFRKIQSTFQLYHLSFVADARHETHYIDRLSGHVGWRENSRTKEQILAGDDILIDFVHHLWPVTSFYISAMPDANGQLMPKAIHFSYLDLKDLQNLFLSSIRPYLSPGWQTLVKELAITGSLEKTKLHFPTPLANWYDVTLKSQFKQIHSAAYKNWPGIKNLSGALMWNGQAGSLLLNSTYLELQAGTFYSHPLFFDQLLGRIEIKEIALKDTKPSELKTWEILIPSLHIENKDLAANLKGSVLYPQKGQSFADLSANLSMDQAQHITDYFPIKIMDKKLVDWLQHAFLAGSLSSAHAVLKGNLSAFPFDKGGGTFSVQGEVKHINLHYADDWPMLQNISGSLVFEKTALIIDGKAGNILGIPLTNVHAVIEDLITDKPSILYAQCDPIKTDFAKASYFVKHSPLQNTLGKIFSGLKIEGPTILDLELIVPLSDPDRTKVKGRLALLNTELNLVPWNLYLDHINGYLNFTEDTAQATNIQASLFNQPIHFDINTITNDKKISVVQVRSLLPLSVANLEKWLNIPISKVASGEALIDMKLDLSLQQPLEIYLASNLEGLALNLGDQFSKPATASQSFSAMIVAEESAPLKIKVNYAHELSAALIIKSLKQEFSLVAATLHLGQGEASWPNAPGLFISGNFKDVDADKLSNYLNQTSGTTTLPALKLRNINLHIDTLSLASLIIQKIDIDVTPEQNEWDIEITSPDLKGEVNTPIKFNRTGAITARFDQLHLHTLNLPNEKPLNFNTINLPPITFIATDTTYNHMYLGALTFKTSLIGDGQTIDLIRLYSSYLNLQAKGRWLQGTKNSTQLQGHATSKNVSDLLASLGFATHNYVLGNGMARFNLSWDGAPYAPSVGHLNGKVSINLGQGRVIEVGQASGATLDIGRLLSLFTLQSLPRRLALNFSDVFQKGYSFDRMIGDLIFRNGNIYTSNLYFDGPLARVGINGRVGLTNKDYDLIISITPHVSTTLPVAAALIGLQPIIGLAALAVTGVIDVSKVTTFYYSVKGPWGNPAWQSVHGQGFQ